MIDNAQLENICSNFLGPCQIQHFEVLGNGNINDTYKVDIQIDHTSHSYVIQRINHQIFKDPAVLMRNISLVTSYLRQSDYPYLTAELFSSVNGNLLVVDEEQQYWRCFFFFPDSYAPEGKTNSTLARRAACAYGAFSNALKDFPISDLSETIPDFHNTDLRWEYFVNVLEQDSVNRGKAAEPEINAMYAAFPVFEQISRLKKEGELPVRVTHNDTKAGNILFHKNTHEAIAVIDLDTVMPGTILSDFGDMVRTFVPDKYEDETGDVNLKLDVLQAVKDGFVAKTNDFLTKTEKEQLMLGAAWIAGEQALRFLTDWLAGDVYYKIQHPEHNLIRAKNQLNLFSKLRELI